MSKQVSYLDNVNPGATKSHYRLVPSKAPQVEQKTFRWTSEHDGAGAGNSFDTYNAAYLGLQGMRRDCPVEGGTWYIAEHVRAGRYKVVYR